MLIYSTTDLSSFTLFFFFFHYVSFYQTPVAFTRTKNKKRGKKKKDRLCFAGSRDLHQ